MAMTVVETILTGEHTAPWARIDTEIIGHHLPNVQLEDEVEAGLQHMVHIRPACQHYLSPNVLDWLIPVLHAGRLPPRLPFVLDGFKLGDLDVLPRLSSIIFCQAGECAKEQLDIDHPVIRREQSNPLLGQIFEGPSLLNLFGGH